MADERSEDYHTDTKMAKVSDPREEGQKPLQAGEVNSHTNNHQAADNTVTKIMLDSLVHGEWKNGVLEDWSDGVVE